MSKIKSIEELKQLQETQIIETTGGKREIISHSWYSLEDEKTCPLCFSLDQKTISANDPIFNQFQPPIHPNCRCLWVSHTSLDPYPPEINWKTPSDKMLKDYGLNVKVNEKEIKDIENQILPLSTLIVPISEKEKKKIIKNKIESIE